MLRDPNKKSILLHSCCGPCSTAVVERLAEEYNITIFYYNPNITDENEYELRLSEQKRFLKELGEKRGTSVDLIEGRYEPERWYEFIKGLEGEPEGGARCEKCFLLRLSETARLAREMGFDCFDSTLSVSPHKDYGKISRIGEELSAETGVEFLSGNYKKRDGYRRSTELSREYGLYRQNYCGCEFSKWFGKKEDDR